MKAANSEYHFSQIEFQILISLFWIDFLKPLSVGLKLNLDICVCL